MSNHLRNIGSIDATAKTFVTQPAIDGPHYNQYYGYETVSDDKEINLFRVFLYVLKYRWMLVTLLVIGLFSALAITLMITPKYRASTQLEVLVPSAKVFQDIEVTSESSDIRAFQTASEKLRSRAIAERVVFNLGLSERADYLFPRASFSPLNIFKRAFGGEAGADELSDFSPEERARMAVERVQKNLLVSLLPNTSLLSISYTDQTPKYTYEIANQVAQSFINQRVDQASDTSAQARKFIQEQVVQAKSRLQQSEEALVEYAKKVGLTVTADNSSLITESLVKINEALGAAVQENLSYGRLVQQIDKGQGASLEPVLESEGLNKLRIKVAELNAEYQQKLGLFKPSFPEMVQLRSQINELQNQLNLGTRAITDSIRLKYQETQSKITDLQSKLTQLEGEQSAYQDKNIQYTILKREVDSNRSQYDSLIAKLNEISISSELKNENAAIVDLAVEPQYPYSPRLILNLAIGLFLSGMVGVAAIYVLELLNNTFATPDQVEKELQLSLLGIIPAVSESELSRAITESQSNMSEAYRSLRTALQFSGEQGAPQILAVTSSEPSEGKSTTILKLAEDFAALGAKVLVIDADMRRPILHRLFKVDNAVGLSNLLTRTIRPSDQKMLIKQIKPHLSLITAGTIPPNPADLLSSSRMGLILEKLSRNYDLILIDSPPVIGLSDALILGRMAEATLLVVSSDQVTRKSATNALKRLRMAGSNMVGAVLTKFSVKKFDYNYNYKYLSYNYYQYGENTSKLEDKVEVKNAAPENNEEKRTLASFNRNLRSYFVRLADRFKSIS